MFRQFLPQPDGRGLGQEAEDEWFEPFSAGLRPKGLDPRAVAVMAEAGVDISGQTSKNVVEFAGNRFDYVVTVCDKARESCPVFPGPARLIHRGFPDPPELPPERPMRKKPWDTTARCGTPSGTSWPACPAPWKRMTAENAPCPM